MSSVSKRNKSINSHHNNAGKWKGAERLQRHFFYTSAERRRLKAELKNLG